MKVYEKWTDNYLGEYLQTVTGMSSIDSNKINIETYIDIVYLKENGEIDYKNYVKCIIKLQKEDKE